MSEIILVTRGELHSMIVEAVEIGVAAFHNRKEKEERYKATPPLNRTQAAKKLGISHQTVKKLISQGRLKSSADGMYVTQQQIDQYLASQ